MHIDIVQRRLNNDGSACYHYKSLLQPQTSGLISKRSDTQFIHTYILLYQHYQETKHPFRQLKPPTTLKMSTTSNTPSTGGKVSKPQSEIARLIQLLTGNVETLGYQTVADSLRKLKAEVGRLEHQVAGNKETLGVQEIDDGLRNATEQCIEAIGEEIESKPLHLSKYSEINDDLQSYLDSPDSERSNGNPKTHLPSCACSDVQNGGHTGTARSDTVQTIRPLLIRPRQVFTGEGRRIWCRRSQAMIAPLTPRRDPEPVTETVDKPVTMGELMGEMEELEIGLNDGWRDLRAAEMRGY